MIFLIAWKNIWRNKVRSLIVMCSICLGLWGGLIAAAFTKGMSEERIQSAIANEVSHIQIHNPSYLQNNDIHDTLSKLQFLVNKIHGLPEFTALAKRFKVTAIATSSTTSAGVHINGIYPEEESRVTNISRCIASSNGRYLKKDKHNEVVIGAKLAEKLKVGLHKKIVLSLQSVDGNIVRCAFRVCGIFKTNNTGFDEKNLFVDYSEIAEITGLSVNSVQEVAILLSSDKQSISNIQRLKSLFPELSVMSWKETLPDLGVMKDFMDQMLYIIMIIILLALCFGIINTMLMVVMERVRELGMLMAVGMSKIRILLMIIYETILLTFTGAAFGMLFGFLTIKILGRVGIDLTAFADGIENAGFSAIVYPLLDSQFYLGLCGMVVLTGVLASIYPARRVLKMNPIDSIRSL
jgi:putative ABC transport system permease protein